jgi:hypothetical protein
LAWFIHAGRIASKTKKMMIAAPPSAPQDPHLPASNSSFIATRHSFSMAPHVRNVWKHLYAAASGGVRRLR